MKFSFWGHFRSVFGFVFIKERFKKKKKKGVGSCGHQRVLAGGYSRPADAWHGWRELPLSVSWTSFSLFALSPKGSIGFPGFPGANGEKGTRVRAALSSCFAAFIIFFSLQGKVLGQDVGNAPLQAGAGLMLWSLLDEGLAPKRVVPLARIPGCDQRSSAQGAQDQQEAPDAGCWERRMPVIAQAALQTTAFQLSTGNFSLKIF